MRCRLELILRANHAFIAAVAVTAYPPANVPPQLPVLGNLTLRANPLEDNLVLWQYVKGKRSSVKWVRNTPSPSGQWHELKLTVVGNKVQGWLNGVLTLSHDLEKPVSGRIGLWSKADSVVYFDDFRVEQIAR